MNTPSPMSIDVYVAKGVRIAHQDSISGSGWLEIGDLSIRFFEPGLARAMAEAAEAFREAGGADAQEGEG